MKRWTIGYKAEPEGDTVGTVNINYMMPNGRNEGSPCHSGKIQVHGDDRNKIAKLIVAALNTFDVEAKNEKA